MLKILDFYKNSKSENMDILDLEFFVEVQYDIFKILSPNNIYRSLPSKSPFIEEEVLLISLASQVQ